ncbi:MAG: endonuclease III [Clostridia bacterium]
MKHNREVFNALQSMHPNAGCELDFSTPFELLVAVILSAQCTDKRVNMATEKLFKVYNTAEAFAALTLEELIPYIYSCGFYNNKGKNILSMSRELAEKYQGEVPKDFDKLTALAGVGRKTASVVLAVAFDIPAMPVDTHVFRVSKRIGLASGNNPDKVERELKELYEEKYWNSLHHYLIFHGRYICKSQKPNCPECLIKPYCGYYNEKENK